MKAFPIAKVLTGVTVLFFTCLSLGAEQTYESCMRSEKNAKANVDSCKEKLKADASDGKFSSADVDRCLEQAAQSKCEGVTSKADVKDLKQACEQAFDKYTDAATEEKKACDSFDKSGGTNCKARVASCQKKIASLNSPFETVKGEDPDDKTNGYNVIEDAANLWVNLQNIKNPNQAQNQDGTLAASGGACVKSIDAKARAADKKEKDRERKELLEKIKKQKDDIIKFKEDLDEERDKNTEEINKTEAENKREELEKDKAKNEKVAAVSKQIVDIGKQLRLKNLVITKKMQELAQTNFTFQSAMVELSESRVKTQCESAFKRYKAAIVAKGNMAGLSPEEQAKVSSLVASSKGIRGSGELKSFLIETRKECYSNANLKRNAMKLKNSQDVKNIQDAIEEEKTNMKEDKAAIATAQKDLATATEQLDKEKNAADVEKGKKLEALSKKLANQITNTKTKTAVANEKIQELTAEINNLMMVKNFEVEDASLEANAAIEKGKRARARAVETCDCKSQAKTHVICSQLGQDSESYDGKKVKSGGTGAN